MSSWENEKRPNWSFFVYLCELTRLRFYITLIKLGREGCNQMQSGRTDGQITDRIRQIVKDDGIDPVVALRQLKEEVGAGTGKIGQVLTFHLADAMIVVIGESFWRMEEEWIARMGRMVKGFADDRTTKTLTRAIPDQPQDQDEKACP